METPISIAQAAVEAKGIIVWSENDAQLQNQKFLFCCVWVGEGGASCFVSVFFETSIFFVSFLKVFVLFFRCHQLLSSFHRISRTQNHMRAAMQVKQIRSRSPQGSQSF